MGWINKIFGSGESLSKKGADATMATLKIRAIEELTKDAVKVVFEVPENLKKEYQYKPGQYLNFILQIEGKEERRSYSICSGVNEPLAIGVKKIKDGVVSSFFRDKVKVGEEVQVAFPRGNFTLEEVEDNYLAIVGGSGVTPVLSIAKSMEKSTSGFLHLLYGNRDDQSIMFEKELSELNPAKIKVEHIFSEQEKGGIRHGMLTEEQISSFLKDNLDLLRSNGFYLCGPEQVIINAQNALKKFGVSEEKMFYELFTVPEKLESTKVEEEINFEGVSKVTVILDEEEEEFELSADGATILEEAESHGVDAPYSCRGAVCCTCRAKVLKGTVKMDKNFTLTDKEIEEGYILTCQSHPTSSELVVTYDE